MSDSRIDSVRQRCPDLTREGEQELLALGVEESGYGWREPSTTAPIPSVDPWPPLVLGMSHASLDQLLTYLSTFTGSEYVTARVARFHTLPVHVRAQVRHFPPEVRACFAERSDLDRSEFEHLVSDPAPIVRLHAVSNPSAPWDLVTSRVRDHSYFVRRAIAARPDVPLDLLLAFTKDPYPAVRASVALLITDPKVLSAVASDASYEVRFAVARNPHTPAEVLGDLGSLAASNPNTPPEVLEALALAGDADAAANPATPTTRFQTLLDDHYLVRAGMAQNPSSPPELLARLQRQHLLSIDRALGANPNTPVEILEALLHSSDHATRVAARRNPATPGDCPLNHLPEFDPWRDRPVSYSGWVLDRHGDLGLVAPARDVYAFYADAERRWSWPDPEHPDDAAAGSGADPSPSGPWNVTKGYHTEWLADLLERTEGEAKFHVPAAAVPVARQRLIDAGSEHCGVPGLLEAMLMCTMPGG